MAGQRGRRGPTDKRNAAGPRKTLSFGKVTLVVYGWKGNQPGTLAWVFPSLGAAVQAVRAFRNALHWVIVLGAEVASAEADVLALRRDGLVLAERFA